MVTLSAFGRLSKDPEVRDTSKSRVASFSLACPVPSGKEVGVAFLDCKAWEPLASVVEGLRKGDAVHIMGTALTNKWDGKDGKSHYKLEIWPTAIIPQSTGHGPAPKSSAPGTAPATTTPADSEDDVPF